MNRKEQIKSAYKQLGGSAAELLAKENGIFRRMTNIQNANAEWTIQ